LLDNLNRENKKEQVDNSNSELRHELCFEAAASGKTYDIIYADPPWKFGSKELYGDKTKDGKRENRFRKLERIYNTMNVDEIKQLPIEHLANKNAALFLWVTDAHLPEGLEVIKAWGFEYKTIVFVWVKKSNKGKTYYNYAPWALKSCEICLLGIRGQMSRMKTSNSVRQLLEEIRTKHSRKPDEARQRIEQLFASSVKIELFAREKHSGWDAFGNEVESDVLLSAAEQT